MPVGARTAEPEVGERDLHEVGVGCCDVVGAERESGALPAVEVLDEHVGPGQERLEPSAPHRVGEVEDDAQLVRVAIRVRERIGCGRGFDADHVGAEVGEDAGTERTAQVGEIDDLQPGQRSRRARSETTHGALLFGALGSHAARV